MLSMLFFSSPVINRRCVLEGGYVFKAVDTTNNRSQELRGREGEYIFGIISTIKIRLFNFKSSNIIYDINKLSGRSDFFSSTFCKVENVEYILYGTSFMNKH